MNRPWSTTPGIALQRRGERLGVADRAKGAIENVMAAVGDEDRAARRARGAVRSGRGNQESARRARYGARVAREAERDDLDRQGEGAEPRDKFGGVGDDDHALGGGGDDFLAQQRAAAALDETQRAVDFVGAVDRQVEFGTIVEGGERNAGSAWACAPSPREVGTPTIDRPALHALAEQIDEMARGRAGSQPELHAGLDKFKRAAGGFALQLFEILQRRRHPLRRRRRPGRRDLAAMAYSLRGRNANWSGATTAREKRPSGASAAGEQGAMRAKAGPALARR